MFGKSLTLLVSLFGTFSLQAASILNPSFENDWPAGQEETKYLTNTAPTGWTVWTYLENTGSMVTGSPQWINSALYPIPAASNGSYFASLESYGSTVDSETVSYAEGGIRTTVSGLTVGSTYTVSVDAATLMLPNQTIYTDEGYLDAYVGGVGATLVLNESFAVTDQIVFDSGANVVSRSIGTYSFTFTASAEEMDIGFRSRLVDGTGSNEGRRYNVSMDNLTIAVPEPSSVMIAGLAGAGALVRRRRI